MPVYQGPILGFDAAGYSQQPNLGQAAVQELIQDELDRAIGKLRSRIGHQIWVNAGDGGYLAMQGDVELGPNVLELFSEHIRKRNAQMRQDALVKMRYALHFGTIIKEQGRMGPAVSGDGINVLERMLTLMPRDRPGQVVISDHYRNILVEDAGMNPSRFQAMADLIDKHGKVHVVWNFFGSSFGVRI